MEYFSHPRLFLGRLTGCLHVSSTADCPALLRVSCWELGTPRGDGRSLAALQGRAMDNGGICSCPASTASFMGQEAPCLEAWVCLLGKSKDKSCWCFALSGKTWDFCVLQGVWGGELGKRGQFLSCFSLCHIPWLKVSSIRCVTLKKALM